MFKRGILTLGLALGVFIGLEVKAQDDETMRVVETDHSTLMGDTLFVTNDQGSLVLVPFEPLMYKSQIDRSIGQADGTSFDQIRENFRRSLDNLLFIEAEQKYSIVRLIVDDPSTKEDLYRMYRNTGQDFRVVPSKKEVKKKKSLKLKKEKEENPSVGVVHGSRVENGQVVSQNDGQERFMARSVKDSAVFDYFYEKYGSVLYVYINQFDIGPMPGLDYRSFESEEYQREIKVHYSIYTHKSEIFSGTAKTWFSSRTNHQKDIILESMPALAAEIIGAVPVLKTAPQ